VRYALEIPKLSSLILKHDLDAPLAGTGHGAPDQQPPVGDGVLVLPHHDRHRPGHGRRSGSGACGAAIRGTLYEDRRLHRVRCCSGPPAWLPSSPGWITTEVGRQPYTIYGELTTAASVSPIAAPAVSASLLVFIGVYFLVFGAGVFYVLRLMGKAPGRSRRPAAAKHPAAHLGPHRSVAGIDLLPAAG
jgi:cytochrome d ubiquinol oxidase subunit I